ncbi:MAG: UDP-N-acetylmuramoyl-L-alanyl-D-glutamate--2,6-diaminopimelate ligase [Desulfovibrio sp.]|nr:UDP-N-acetylmuramoyl-L-alanyl-D-glutamate--2,6-diaminopimelate ligase [Desulfovibrio sp.]
MQCEFAAVLSLLTEERAGVSVDSRTITPGDVFVAVPGEVEDGTKYIPNALANGARYIVCSEEALLPDIPADIGVCRVPRIREAVPALAEARYHTKTNTVRLLGLTGTNGKTTCCAMLEHLFTRLGEKVGVLGTISYRWPGHVEDAPLTTPDPLRLHAMLHAMEQAGCSTCVMEVSSHALSQQRVDRLPFAGAALTNVTQDHLDFHKTMENYFACKAKLFCELPKREKAMAINADDSYGRRLLALCPNALAYGFAESEHRQVVGTILQKDIHGLLLRMRYQGKTWDLASPLLGAFNAANLLTVQALAIECGVPIEDLGLLADFRGVCGRLERVPAGGRHVFVDYAHTPDALINVLHAVRDAGFRRIITVFGCGGNRDRTKRPLMGKAVAAFSDCAIVTSDNPRFEDPLVIIDDIMPGLAGAKDVHVEPDRRKATKLALSLATEPDDCVLIAGKGHEPYQIIKGVRTHYSDQEVVEECLSCS